MIKKTVVTTVELTCDGCGERAMFTLYGQGIMINREIRKIGWAYDPDSNKDYCPSCRGANATPV